MDIKIEKKPREKNIFSDLRSYSRQWVTGFINTYRNEVCLWQTKHPDYNNQLLRAQAYDKLLEKLKEVEANPNRSMVVRKINSLRSAFRREYRKKCQRPDYEPRLWYYNALTFIADQQSNITTISRICTATPTQQEKDKRRLFSETFDEDDEVLDNPVSVEISDNDVEQSHEDLKLNQYEEEEEVITADMEECEGIKDESTARIIEIQNVNSDQEMITIDSMSHQQSMEELHSSQNEKNDTQHHYVTFHNIHSPKEEENHQNANSIGTQQQHYQHHHHLQTAVQTIQLQPTRESNDNMEHGKSNIKMMKFYKSPECIPIMSSSSKIKHEDEFDAIGVNVASKLRQMNGHQRIIAEKLISDVLFSGQLNNLSINSKLSN